MEREGRNNELMQSHIDSSPRHETISSFSGELAGPDRSHRLKGDQRDTEPLSAPPPCVELELGSVLRLPPKAKKVDRVANELYIISHLIFFSMMGTLARLGLQALTTYPEAPVKTTVLWANFGGSLIIGFLTEDRNLFSAGQLRARTSMRTKRREEQSGNPAIERSQQVHRDGVTHETHLSAVKKSTPLYIGLGTGFCGSLTSFSAFIRDAFLALSNSGPVATPEDSHSTRAHGPYVHRHPGYGVLAVLAVIMTTLMISVGGLQIGAHLALALEPFTPSLPLPFVRRWVDRSMLLVAWVSWLGVILMTIWPPDRPGASVGRATWAQEAWRTDALFALVFAPLGCLLRFYASVHLNPVRPSFPPGTYAVNMAGTALSAILFDIQHIPMANRVGCQVLQGAMDGFCGSLTTVSTWVVELRGLRFGQAYFYGVMSVGVGLGLATVIMGSLRWSIGFQTPSCND